MTHKLIGLGYWRSLYEPILPDPACFVDESWPADTRQAVANYLNQGRKLHCWMGYSWCRFRCNASAAQMGACDLTDGTYCWPEGLSHYVRHHGARLPEQVVAHILSHTSFPHAKANQATESQDINLDWWISQRGNCPDNSSFPSETDQEIKNFVRRYDQHKLDFESYTELGLRSVIQLVRELKSTATI